MDLAPATLLRDALRAEEEGAIDHAFDRAELALRAFEAARDHEGAAAALQLMAGLSLRRGFAHEACRYLEHALGLREAHRDTAEQLSLLRDLVAARLHLGDTASAVGAARRALQLAETFEDRDGVLQALHQLAHLLVDQRAFEEATARIERGLALATAPGDQRARAALLLLHSRVHQATGDLVRARALADDALAAAESASFRPVIADVVHHLARLLLAGGDVAGARRRLIETIDSRVLLKDGRGRAVALQELAAIDTALGDHAGGLERLLEAAVVHGAAGQPAAQADALGAAATLQETLGDVDAALATGQRAIAAACEVGPDLAFRTMLNQAERATRAGAWGQAADVLGAVVDLPGLEPAQRATGLAMRGQILAALGHTAPAIAALVSARDTLRPLDASAAREIEDILVELGHDYH